MSETAKIGLFGGTFDPVHLGHLIMAEQCREQAKLDQVWFIPAARPPHKPDGALTPFRQRVEMLELALAGHAAFRIDELEQERPGPSYTADTLDILCERHPGNAFHLIVGSDCLPDLPSWHEPAHIAERAGLLVVARPSWPLWPIQELCKALRLSDPAALRYQIIHAPLIEIASRDLRQRCAEGRSLRYLVPRAIECYIETHRLYRAESV
jgi:nicotinate-nucleotide adenylyltransferase